MRQGVFTRSGALLFWIFRTKRLDLLLLSHRMNMRRSTGGRHSLAPLRVKAAGGASSSAGARHSVGGHGTRHSMGKALISERERERERHSMGKALIISRSAHISERERYSMGKALII